MALMSNYLESLIACYRDMYITYVYYYDYYSTTSSM